MRRFLIVGCGGSGGATLALMMDQLRSELHTAGIEKLPAGWQFVHIDVPSAAESGPEGLANVPAQGGSYIGCGPQGSSYAVLDGALSQRLAAESALDTIATWAPRNPQEVSIPISAGAGQYRAIGRMITLSKAAEIHARLQAAWDELFRVETVSEMSTLDVPGMGRFDANEPPLVLVVSSMAGGAGASMALDVCRLLTLVSGLDPRLMGVFMVTPDIFDSLPQSAIIGVRANSLAMLGEIVASQSGAAREHDVRVLRALGHHHGEGEPIPFARVFPVGRYIGAERTLFGDGSQYAVYRGLARGLAGLMMSGKASDQFVAYDLGNTASPVGDRDLLGWGISSWDVLPWGTYGFSSLSMGRDRYAEYGAQRLARSCVDKLLDGHMQTGNPASSIEQLDSLLSSQWAAHCKELGIPASAGEDQTKVSQLGRWIGTEAFAAETVASTVNGLIDRQLRGYLPNPEGMAAEQWTPILKQAVVNRRAELTRACTEAGYAMGFTWHQGFADRLERVVASAIATMGLPYARELIEQLRRHIDDKLAAPVAQLGTMGPPDIVAISPQVDASLKALHGVMTNTDQVVAAVLDGFRATVRRQLFADAAARIAEVMRVMGAEMLAPLRDALSEAMIQLERARSEPPTDVGLARLSTDQYAAWPADADELVPGRFAEANNEVLLINSTAFKARYEADLPKAVAGAQRNDAAALGDRRGDGPGDPGGVADHRRRGRARRPDRTHDDLGDPRAGHRPGQRSRAGAVDGTVRRPYPARGAAASGAALRRAARRIVRGVLQGLAARLRPRCRSLGIGDRDPPPRHRDQVRRGAVAGAAAGQCQRPSAATSSSRPADRIPVQVLRDPLRRPAGRRGAVRGAAHRSADRPGDQGELRAFDVGRGQRDPHRHLRVLPELLTAGV